MFRTHFSQHCAPTDEHSSFINEFEFSVNDDKIWELHDRLCEDPAQVANTTNDESEPEFVDTMTPYKIPFKKDIELPAAEYSFQIELMYI